MESQRALGGAERRSAVVCLLSAATGGPDASEDAGEGGPARHQRQEGSTHACEAPDKREGLHATRHGAMLTSDNSLTKKRHCKTEFY